MANTKFGNMLEEAGRQGRAVGAFTCYNVEGLEAVIRAAERRRAPAIVLVSPSSFKGAGGDRLVKGFLAMSAGSTADVLVQLDHVSDPRLTERAAECGIDAVMADGSKLPYADNLDFTRAVVQAVRGRGVGVEAELGRVEGHEDRAGETMSGEMTDPDEAESFVNESGADCLAVAVGNVHGHYSGIPKLDWSRLEEIRSTVPSPLSLHGASGLTQADLRRAVSTGVVKVNVNTELRAAYFKLLESDLLASTSASLDTKSLGDALTEAIQEVVEEKLEAFGWTKGDPQ